MGHNYDDWPKERLISHLRKLENTLRNARVTQLVEKEEDQHGAEAPVASTSTLRKEFIFSDHPTRKIALRFAYDGSHYNGLEHQRDVTPLPTVEETLWDALVKTRLVDPEGDFDSHGWEKCGRTDRGVSAAGQVISLWIRCKTHGHPQREPQADQPREADCDHPETRGPVPTGDGKTSDVAREPEGELDENLAALIGWDEPPTNNTLPTPSQTTPLSTPGAAIELNYVTLLNNVLPSTLRVLSWSPVAPSFSARFNCRSRHYKYFFSSRGLDIEAMRNGAKRLVGEHDWRNLCKIDPAKFRVDAEGEDRWSFRRIVKLAEVNPVHESQQLNLDDHSTEEGDMYVFDLVGTAFLYNQVRHIMAVLFLIGSGLEEPSIINALLNVDASNTSSTDNPSSVSLPVVSAKPTYQMADALPLVLWDCHYDENDVRWVGDCPAGAASISHDNFSDVNGLYAELRAAHERSCVQTALQEHFRKAASRFHRPPREFLPFIGENTLAGVPNGTTLAVPLGGGTYRNTRIAGGKGYVKLLDRKRLDEVEVTWERWRSGKGAKRTKRDDSQAAGPEARV